MVVTVLIILFFMTNTMTGNMIASEVTQEKSSRIMEILITSVSPLAQMFEDYRDVHPRIDAGCALLPRHDRESDAAA